MRLAERIAAASVFHGISAVAELKLLGCFDLRADAGVFHGISAVAELKLDSWDQATPAFVFSTASAPWPN